MLSSIKLLLSITDTTEDELISLLIDMAKEEAASFCHLSSYDSTLDTIVIKMVLQLYNRLGNEGLNSSSYGGAINENYMSNYSDDILTELKRHRKIITV